MKCACFIIPHDVLLKFAYDPELTEEIRRVFSQTAEVSRLIRAARERHTELTQTARLRLGFTVPPAPTQLPAAAAYDCHHGVSLPGTPVANPGSSPDATVHRAYSEALKVADFYWKIFGRDSIDGHHMTLVSSVHYSNRFNNAFWNGSQMTYGDGDGQIFVDFTLGNDVIGHELTHGVTQHSSAFSYANEAGGLNESISDVFGSMFRQWAANQDVTAADWLIGKDIMGPVAKARGYTCLRDMANPAAAHCLAPQPTQFSQYHAGMDPHVSSGIPNLAFCNAAKAAGGHSWEKVGKIWYKALTGFPASPNMLMSQFAHRTRALSVSMFPGDTVVKNAVDGGWHGVGL